MLEWSDSWISSGKNLCGRVFIPAIEFKISRKTTVISKGTRISRSSSVPLSEPTHLLAQWVLVPQRFVSGLTHVQWPGKHCYGPPIIFQLELAYFQWRRFEPVISPGQYIILNPNSNMFSRPWPSKQFLTKHKFRLQTQQSMTKLVVTAHSNPHSDVGNSGI